MTSHRFFQSAPVYVHTCVCTVDTKKSDVSIPFCLVQTEVKQLFHAQHMETEWDGVW